MGLYFFVFVIVFLLAFKSINSKTDRKFDTRVTQIYILISAMLCFRYGQGTDYFSYQYIFSQVSSFDRLRTVWHGEPLFLFLCFIFNRLANYQVFVMTISFVQMLMIWKFINRYSENKIVSILVFLSVVYIVYFCSLMRQGLAISIFLGYGTELLERRDWKKYFALCLVLSLIHSVSAIYFLVPAILKLSLKSLLLSIVLCAVMSVTILPRTVGHMIPYYDGHPMRLVTAAERALSFIMIYSVYLSVYEGKPKKHWWIKLYSFGTALYFLFLPSSLIASRLAACFKGLEIIIVPFLMSRKSSYKKIFVYYFFALSLVMFSHSLMAETETGGYVQRINFVNFPYVSIFNADSIYNYRKF